MLNETTLLSYLNSDDGWVIGKSRTPYTYRGQDGTKQQILFSAASNDARGVYLRWFACDSMFESIQHGLASVVGGHREWAEFAQGLCCKQQHIHLEVRVRTKAGGFTKTSRNRLTVPHDLTVVSGARGTPPNKKVTKSTLPQPYQFCQEEWLQHMLPTGQSPQLSPHCWERMTMLSYCELVGPVGISDNAKVLADMALRPGEDVWFHFDCTAPGTATYDIIVNGDCDLFYPLNRRSKRITTNLKPKASIDLTKLSVIDQRMLLHAIQVYVAETF